MTVLKERQGTSILESVVIAVTLAGIFSIAFSKIIDYDIWFHLRAGKHIVENLSIPHSDIFSHTAYGKEWVTHEWLFEAGAYLLWYVTGLWGLGFLKALTVTAIFGIFICSLNRSGVSPFLSAPVAAIAAVLARERYLERPELVTYLFSAAFIALLERFGRGEGPGKRYFLILPALMVLWSNLHSGAIFGVIITGAYATGEAFDSIVRKRRTGKGRGYIIIAAAVLAAGLLNPITYKAYTYPFLALKISKETGLNLLEYTPPSWPQDLPFFIAAAVFTAIIALGMKKMRSAGVLLYAFFLVSAFRFNRNIAMWAFVSTPFVAEALYRMKGSLPAKITRLYSRESVSMALSLSLSIIFIAPFLAGGIADGSWGPGARTGRFPEGAIRFLEENRIGGNMFNSYELGGYLMWRAPERKVYIDGRSEIYADLLNDQRMLSALGFENIVEKYGINYVVMSYLEHNADYINPDPYFGEGLALVYWDDVAMVYLKRTPENSAVIEKHEYRAVRPADRYFKFSRAPMEEMIREIERNVRENPLGLRNHLLLANAYGLMGDTSRAEIEAQIVETNKASLR